MLGSKTHLNHPHKNQNLDSLINNCKILQQSESQDTQNQEGIINGKGAGLLDSKGKATRAEAAQIMQNFLLKSDLGK